MPAARIDMHTHTVVSDGTLTPAQLVDLASREGLAAIALTDHDHVGGVAEARAEGSRVGVRVVAGIELSLTHDAGDVHLLGYGIDVEHAPLLARLETLRNARAERGVRIVEKLRALGVDITLADVAREAEGSGALGRPHVARALVAKGRAASIEDAFAKWLGDGRPAHVPKAKLGAEEGIALVRAAGGAAVLAHAGLIREEQRETLVRELAKLGMTGLEVAHPKHAPETRRKLAAWADELGLVQTGGSDFHGENKPGVKLGQESADTLVLSRLGIRL